MIDGIEVYDLICLPHTRFKDVDKHTNHSDTLVVETAVTYKWNIRLTIKSNEICIPNHPSDFGYREDNTYPQISFSQEYSIYS